MSTFVSESATKRRGLSEDVSLGALVSDATADLQKLVRQEVALAKAELREEASKAAKGARAYGGAGFAGYMTVVLLSFAAIIGIGHLLGIGWAALIVAGVWGVAGAIMYALGHHWLHSFSPKPQRTMETLREDAHRLRHPIEPKAVPGPSAEEPPRALYPPTGVTATER